MNIKQAKQELINTVHAYLLKNSHGEYEIPPMRQRPVLLMGPPGIGKTQIMEQAARECGIGLVSYTITHHTRQSAIGLPFISEKSYGGEKKHVTEYTMSEIVASVYDKMEETGLREGILFIDEINCVSETLAPAMLQFLQYKTFGNHRLPEGWIVAAAGNPPEYNKSVRDFDIATLDRVKRIQVEADYEAWKEYAKEAGIHPAIQSYLTVKPQNFYQMETTVDGKMFATPRGWEDLSRFLEVYEKLGLDCGRDVAAQYLQHPKTARDFANYLELYRKYQARYQIEEVLAGKRDERLMEQAARASFDERLSIVGLLLSGLGTAFGKAAEKEEYLELLFGALKSCRERLEESGPGVSEAEITGRENAAGCAFAAGQDGRNEKTAGEGGDPAAALAGVIDEFRTEHERKRKAGLLTRSRHYRCLEAEESLNACLQMVRAERLTENKDALDRIRQWFGEEQDRYEKICEEGLRRLEHAFDFMEGTFGDSQEMVIFITELNTDPKAVRFLSENECERYYQYNKRLLFEEREADTLRRLDRLGVF